MKDHHNKLLRRVWSQITHKSFKLDRTEIFDGIGPASPLEYKSLQ